MLSQRRYIGRHVCLGNEAKSARKKLNQTISGERFCHHVLKQHKWHNNNCVTTFVQNGRRINQSKKCPAYRNYVRAYVLLEELYNLILKMRKTNRCKSFKTWISPYSMENLGCPSQLQQRKAHEQTMAANLCLRRHTSSL